MTRDSDAVDRLRGEYRRVGLQLNAMRDAGALFDPDVLRLEAREVEIVDQLRALGLPPDVLVKV